MSGHSQDITPAPAVVQQGVKAPQGNISHATNPVANANPVASGSDPSGVGNIVLSHSLWSAIASGLGKVLANTSLETAEKAALSKFHGMLGTMFSALLEGAKTAEAAQTAITTEQAAKQ